MFSSQWAAFVHRLRGDLHRCATSAAIVMIGALFVALAVGLAIAGGYLWLSTLVPNYLAAFAVAGGLFLVGIVAIFAALRRPRRPKPAASALPPETDAEFISRNVVQVALAEVARTPIQAVLAATALGIVVGILRARKSP